MTANAVEPLPLHRPVTDHAESLRPREREGWMPPRHVNGHVPRYDGVDDLPPSLRQAVYAFILSCAARRVRGHSGEHNSMLVHVTRYTVVQHAVFSQVERLLQQLAPKTRQRRRRFGGNGCFRSQTNVGRGLRTHDRRDQAANR